MSRVGIKLTALLAAGFLGCSNYATEGNYGGPDTPDIPATPTLVGAVVYGAILTHQTLSSSAVSFEVLNADCTMPVEGVSAESRLPSKKKYSYKYQLTVERITFLACVRVRASYTYGPDDPIQVVEQTQAVTFNPQGAGMAPVGIQIDLPLPR